MRDFAFPPQHDPMPPRHGGIGSHRLARRAWRAGAFEQSGFAHRDGTDRAFARHARDAAGNHGCEGVVDGARRADGRVLIAHARGARGAHDAFVELAQAILYRGAGFEAVWAPFLALATIGAVLFALSLARFRKTIALMA